jgi:hypothetical protein
MNTEVVGTTIETVLSAYPSSLVPLREEGSLFAAKKPAT